MNLLWPQRTPARCQNRATPDPVDLAAKSTIKTDVWVGNRREGAREAFVRAEQGSAATRGGGWR